MSKPNHDMQRLAEAQAMRTLMISGRNYSRVSYGSEGAGPTCCCCGAARGQLHVARCLIERCPICRVEQLGFCDCSKRP